MATTAGLTADSALSFNLRAFKGIIVQDLLHAGMDLYEEVHDSRALKNIHSNKRPRQAALRDTDPWQ